MDSKVEEIMLEKLEEMSELDFNDFQMGETAYSVCCSVMNDIAKTLLGNQQSGLNAISTKELVRELIKRDDIVYQMESGCCISGAPGQQLTIKTSAGWLKNFI